MYGSLFLFYKLYRLSNKFYLYGKNPQLIMTTNHKKKKKKKKKGEPFGMEMDISNMTCS
jgi:hypothetical protein